MTLELSLSNFRCWESKDISFPTSGICLINARSGKGKSSILNSILYVITGKLKNITTINKKNTKVTLKVDNITITRSRGPNRLCAEKDGKIYENEEAQSIINSIFGEEFSNTSYVDQENMYSFVYLSPSDKMEFLEKLLLQNYDIEKLKEKIKNEISKTKTNYSSEESKIDTLESVLSDNLSNIKDIKDIDNEEKDLIIDKIKITNSNYEKIKEKMSSNREISEKNSKTLRLKIKKLEDDQILFIKKNEKVKNLRFLLENIKNNDLFKDIINIDIFEKELILLEESKKYYIKNKELLSYKKRKEELSIKLKKLQDNRENEMFILQNKIEELKIKSISKILNKKRILDLEKCLVLIDDISSLEEKINTDRDFECEIKKETEKLEKSKSLLSLNQKKISDAEKSYQCPSCNVSLKIDNNKLILCSENNDIGGIDMINIMKKNSIIIIEEIKSIESSISLIKKDQSIFQKSEEKYNDLFDELDNLRGDIECEKDCIKKEIEYISEYIDLSDKLKYSRDDKFIEDIKSELLVVNNNIKKLEDNKENKEIKENINNEEEYINCLDKISLLQEKISQIKVLNSKVISIESELLNICGEKEECDKNYTELLKIEREKLELYISKNEKYKSCIEKLDKWYNDNKEIERYKNIKKTIEESNKNKKYLSNRLRCLVKIREHIKNAEQKCISDFIESLNEHASNYIEQFFPDEDIRVELKTLQETKSTGKEKICLNFELSYKQINGDLSYLSGGERDRVNLAFTLAFSEMINNRILLLDECISSLDGETTNVVLENLRERYKGKLVIIVSHQANQGFFDEVINL